MATLRDFSEQEIINKLIGVSDIRGKSPQEAVADYMEVSRQLTLQEMLADQLGITRRSKTIQEMLFTRANALGLGLTSVVQYSEQELWQLLRNNITNTYPLAKILNAPFFRDNFDDNITDTARWASNGNHPAIETGGCCQVTSIAGGEYNGRDSVTSFNLTGAEFSSKIVNAGNQSIESWEFYPILATKDSNNQLSFMVAGGNILARKKIAGESSTVGDGATYNATTHKYVRIREASGVIYYEYSANRTSWTELAHFDNPFAITAMKISFLCGTWQAEGATTTGIVDDIWGKYS